MEDVLHHPAQLAILHLFASHQMSMEASSAPTLTGQALYLLLAHSSSSQHVPLRTLTLKMMLPAPMLVPLAPITISSFALDKISVSVLFKFDICSSSCLLRSKLRAAADAEDNVTQNFLAAADRAHIVEAHKQCNMQRIYRHVAICERIVTWDSLIFGIRFRSWWLDASKNWLLKT